MKIVKLIYILIVAVVVMGRMDFSHRGDLSLKSKSEVEQYGKSVKKRKKA